jgi:hypothetical protein
MGGKILKWKLDVEKMVHNNFVVLNEISHRLKLVLLRV